MRDAKVRIARNIPHMLGASLIAVAATVVDAQPSTDRGQAVQAQNFLRLRLVRVMDNEGFGQPVEAFRFLAPVDWKVNAWLKWNLRALGCPAKGIDSGVQAVGPDGLIGFEIMGADGWRWIDEPQMRAVMQRAADDSTRLTGTQSCGWSPIVTAGDYLRQVVLTQRRPGAQLLGVEPDVNLTQVLDSQGRPSYAPLIAQKLIAGYRVDAARMRVGYRVNNAPVEEWITGAITSIASSSPSMAQLAGGGGAPVTTVQSTTDFVIAARAPAGRMQDAAPLFEVIFGTLRGNPQWAAAVAAHRQELARIGGRGEMDRARIWREAGQAIAGMQAEIYSSQQRVQSNIASQFSQTIRGVQRYGDPTSGQPVELTGGYRQAFSNGRGEYILSNDPNFNPSAVLREQWHAMEPLRSPGG